MGGGLFGQQPQQQQQQQPGAFGGFGAAQQKPGFGQGAGFGGTQGGLFGQPQQQQPLGQQPGPTFGGGTGGSLFGGTPGGTGGFGQTQPSGGGLFGAQQTQPQQTGLFNQTQNTGAFGLQPQQQQPQGQGLFGQGTGFNQSAGGGFGQKPAFGQPQQQQQPGTGFFGQNQAQTQLGSSGGIFNQGASNLFGQNQQPQQPTLGGQGLFGQQQPTQVSAFGMNPMGQSQGQAPVGPYADQSKYQNMVSTIGQMHQPKIVTQDDQRNGQWNLQLKTCRAQDHLAAVSCQMLRFIDYQQQRGVQQPSYEFLAMQEFAQNQGKYKPELLQQIQQISGKSLNQKPGGAFGTGGSLGGSWPQKAPQSPVFGQQTQSGFQTGFAQPQQQNQSNFGAFNKPQTTGLFGQQPAMGAQQPAQTGGMFGQQPNTTGTGLFGQTQAPPAMQSQTTGLFGGQQAPQIQVNLSGGGLFGKPATSAAGSGLFGQQQQPQTQTGLFGQTPQVQQQTQPGLFGGAQQPQQPGAGLFAQKPGGALQQPGLATPQTAQAPGGLFGQKPAQPGGLFGQPGQPAGQVSQFQAQPAPAGGLFGQTTAQPQTGLFGAQAAAQPGGLFGGVTTTQPQTGLFNQPAKPAGGLFSQPAGLPQAGQPGLFGPSSLGQGMAATNCFPMAIQPQQNQAQVANPAAGLLAHYQNADPFDMNTGFISKPSPIQDFQKELDKMKQQAKESPSLLIQPQDQPQFTQNYEYTPQVDMYALHMAYEVEKQRQLAKQEAKYRVLKQQIEQSQLQSRKSSISDAHHELKPFSSKNSTAEQSLYRKGSMQSMSNFAAPKPDFSKRSSAMSTNTEDQNVNKDVVKLVIGFKYEETQDAEIKHYPEFLLTFKIHKQRDMKDVYERVQKWMENDFNYLQSRDGELKLTHEGRHLEKSILTLSEIGLQNDAKLMVNLVDLNKPKEEVQIKVEVPKNKEMAPESIIPKPPKNNVKMEPDIVKMSRMSTEELKAVQGLKFWNEFGSIEYSVPVDVTEVDFADIISIESGAVQVYDELRHKDNYPQVGEKLNRPALITLNGIKPKNGQTATDKEKSLKKNIDKDGAEHISYDAQTFTWVFKVAHFTRYGHDGDEDSKDSTSNVNAKSELGDYEREMDQEMDNIESISIVSDRNIFDTIQTAKKPLYSINDVSISKQRKKEELFESQLVEVPKKPIVSKEMQNEAELKNKKNEELLAKIKARDAQFAKEKMASRIPNNKATDVIKGMQAGRQALLAKTNLWSGGMPRPCFHPNGNMAFVSGKNIKIVSTKPQEKEFSILDVLLKWKQVAKEADMQKIFGDLRLSSSKTGSNNFMMDQYFANLLSQSLPSFRLFATQNPQMSLNHFLHDLAKQMGRACSHDETLKKQLTHEFYVVCMMNALFGNPLLLLHQFHPDYHGPNSLGKQELLFMNNPTEQLELLIAEKIRRNALTELLKFVCSNEFQAFKLPAKHSSEQVYQRVKDLVLNGDIKEAVKCLIANKKTKCAMILSQCVNATQNMAQFKIYKDQAIKQHGPLAEILAIVTGDLVQGQWQQKLLCQLMYGRPATDLLTEILQHKSSVLNGKEQDAMLILLKVFVKMPCQAELDGFEFKLTPSSTPRNCRLKWLLSLVISHLIEQQINQDGRPSNIYQQKYFSEATSKYVDQLLQAKDWKTALIVTLLLPQEYFTQRQRLTFEILTRHATLKLADSREFIIKQTEIPQTWISMSLALKDQQDDQIESAVANWLAASNFSQAHDLFFSQVLPLYMTKSSGVQLLKALTQEGLNPSERKRLILGNEICARQGRLDEFLLQFEVKRNAIKNWQFQGGLFKCFVELISSISEKAATIDQVRHTKEISAMRKLIAIHFSGLNGKPSRGLIVPYFIDMQLSEIEVQLKVLVTKSASGLGSKSMDSELLKMSFGANKVDSNKALTHRNFEYLAVGLLGSALNI